MMQVEEAFVHVPFATVPSHKAFCAELQDTMGCLLPLHAQVVGAGPAGQFSFLRKAAIASSPVWGIHTFTRATECPPACAAPQSAKPSTTFKLLIDVP